MIYRYRFISEHRATRGVQRLCRILAKCWQQRKNSSSRSGRPDHGSGRARTAHVRALPVCHPQCEGPEYQTVHTPLIVTPPPQSMHLPAADTFTGPA
jgi:hypothetical protein